jgi:triosephosphate isomerase
MTPDIRPLVAGNWKMNGTRENLDQIKAIADGLGPDLTDKIDALICPPATLLYVATAIADETPLAIGAQDCHSEQSGAFTGDISAQMIADCLADYVLVGHSERRTLHKESDATIRAKAEAAKAGGLVRVICIGETEAERKSGDTLKVLETQLAGSVPDGATAKDTVIAYEPVWAIGTGLTPTVGGCGRSPRIYPRADEKPFCGRGGHTCGFSMAARSSRPMPLNCLQCPMSMAH